MLQLPVIPTDKASHFIYGAVAYLLAAAAAMAIGFSHPDWFGLSAAAGIGIAKEGMDWLSNRKAKAAGTTPTHGVEPLDAVATSLGGLACYLGSVLV